MLETWLYILEKKEKIFFYFNFSSFSTIWSLRMRLWSSSRFSKMSIFCLLSHDALSVGHIPRKLWILKIACAVEAVSTYSMFTSSLSSSSTTTWTFPDCWRILSRISTSSASDDPVGSTLSKLIRSEQMYSMLFPSKPRSAERSSCKCTFSSKQDYWEMGLNCLRLMICIECPDW